MRLAGTAREYLEWIGQCIDALEEAKGESTLGYHIDNQSIYVVDQDGWDIVIYIDPTFGGCHTLDIALAHLRGIPYDLITGEIGVPAEQAARSRRLMDEAQAKQPRKNSL